MFARPVISIVRDDAKLGRILAEQDPGGPPPPRIDYRTRQAVLVSVGPRSSTGYSLHVAGVVEDRRRILVLVRESAPDTADRVQARLTYPALLLTMPRSPKKVNVHYAGR